MALGAVGEDRDGGQKVAQGHLAAGEDGARREGELRLASLALEDAASLVLVDLDAAALRAEGMAIGQSPADCPERRERFVVRHPHDLGEAQRAGFAGEEEVL